MFSELIGIGCDGKLHQWKWSSETPFQMSINIENQQQTQQYRSGQILVYHPKTLFLQLVNEKICGLSTSTVRASCWTESGKVNKVFFFFFSTNNYQSKKTKF